MRKVKGVACSSTASLPKGVGRRSSHRIKEAYIQVESTGTVSITLTFTSLLGGSSHPVSKARDTKQLRNGGFVFLSSAPF